MWGLRLQKNDLLYFQPLLCTTYSEVRFLITNELHNLKLQFNYLGYVKVVTHKRNNTNAIVIIAIS